MGTRRRAVGACCGLVLAVTGIASGSASAASGVYGWGWNEFGQLGLGSTGGTSNLPAPLALSEVEAVSAGNRFALAALADGTVDSWGEATGGRLGGPEFRSSPTPISGLSDVTAVATGREFGLALKSDGTVEAWGSNLSGQLGDGSFGGERYEPAPVSGLSEVKAIAAGGGSGYALLASGTVMAWGANNSGQLGNGTRTGADKPVAVGELSGVKAIAAGAAFGLALLENGEVRSWGTNTKGEMGNGVHEGVSHPEAVAHLDGTPLTGVTVIAAGDEHALALLEGGTAVGWGSDGNGEVGNGEEGGSGFFISRPMQVEGLTGATAIAAGGNHSVAVVSGGELKAWGGDEFGEVGNGKSRAGLSFYAPVAVACGLSGASSVAAGQWTAFAVGSFSGYDCPNITEVSPSTLPPGGTTVTITGSNLAAATAVAFETWEGETIPAQSFIVESDSKITAVAPVGEKGRIRVTTPAGTSAPDGGSQIGYEPGVGSVTPDLGPAGGGATVTIKGNTFKEVTQVSFDGTPAASFKVLSLMEIEAVAPAGKGTVDVNVTTSSGTLKANPADSFTYLSGPEYGRCKETKFHEGGQFHKSSCTQLATNSGYEWFPASLGTQPLAKRGTTLTGTSVKFETASKAVISCTAISSGGAEFASGETVTGTLTLTGCKDGSANCHSPSAAVGEVRSAALTGTLGVISANGGKQKIGLQFAATSGEVLAEFSCEATSVVIRGSVIFEVKSVDKMVTSFSLKTKGSKGVQSVTHFQGAPGIPLEASLGGHAYEGIDMTAAPRQTSEEALEINTEV